MQQLLSPRGPAYKIRVEDVVTIKAEVSAKCHCGHEGPVDMFRVVMIGNLLVPTTPARHARRDSD